MINSTFESMFFRLSFIICMLISPCLQSVALAGSPEKTGSGGNPNMFHDIFSIAYQAESGKNKRFGVYFSKPYFYFDIKAFGAVYSYQFERYYLALQLTMDGNKSYVRRIYSLKSGLKMKDMQLNCSLSYLNKDIARYDKQNTLEGCLSATFEISKQVSAMICLKGSAWDKVPLIESLFNLKVELPKSNSIYVYFDKGAVLEEGLIFTVCHESKNRHKFVLGVNYKGSSVGLGLSGNIGAMDYQLGLTYHQFLGSGIANGWQYAF